jgi:WD40 repeat protein
MADVFISYANQNRDTARKLAASLEAHGWSVWWDRKIQAGQSFDQAIERELETARSVVVLWSKDSISSEWVKNEAALAAERGVLVPALIDSVRPPLEFRRRQAADLIGWDGDTAHPGFQALIDAITSTTNIAAVAPPSIASPPARTLGWKRAGILVAIATIAIALAAYWVLHDMQRTQDVSGRWDFEPNEKRLKMYIDLKMVGGKLVGREVIAYPQDALTVRAGLKREAPVLDGQIVGDRISFITRRTYNKKPSDDSTKTEAIHRYDGKIDGAKIYFTFSDDQAGDYWEVTAIRQPKEKTAELVATLEGHRGVVEQLELLPDGRLASASRDSTVKIWNLSTLKAEMTLDHGSQVWGVVALPGERLVTADRNGKVRIWNLRTGKVEIGFTDASGTLERIAVLRDGRIGGSSDGGIVLWNVATGAIEQTLKVDGRWFQRFAAMRDGRLATGDQSGTIKIWNLSSGQPEVIVRQGKMGSTDHVTALIELEDGGLAFATADSKETTIWSPGAGKNEIVFPVTPGQRAQELARMAGGRLAVLETENLLTVWNLATGKKETAFEVGHDPWAAGGVRSLPDGRLAIGIGDGTIELWKLR